MYYILGGFALIGWCVFFFFKRKSKKKKILPVQIKIKTTVPPNRDLSDVYHRSEEYRNSKEVKDKQISSPSINSQNATVKKDSVINIHPETERSVNTQKQAEKPVKTKEENEKFIKYIPSTHFVQNSGNKTYPIVNVPKIHSTVLTPKYGKKRALGYSEKAFRTRVIAAFQHHIKDQYYLPFHGANKTMNPI